VETGYYHHTYAESFAEYGAILPLPDSGGWLLKRPIPGTNLEDAMGCYPLLCCTRWQAIGDDIERLAGRVVTVSAVTDPFGDYSLSDLHRSFDTVTPFKEHFVADLSIPQAQRLSKHHRRDLRRASRFVSVERCDDPLLWLEQWIALYHNLSRRHRIRGMTDFSPTAFKHQFQVPGLVAYCASVAGEICAMVLWYVSGKVAYFHLAASSEVGYRKQASYALVGTALDDLVRRGCSWADLGAGAGIRENENNGLAYFKAGWSTGRRTAYFCGKILDHATYNRLAEAGGKRETAYFPAYREGEFS
jgi:hypothetical protein